MNQDIRTQYQLLLILVDATSLWFCNSHTLVALKIFEQHAPLNARSSFQRFLKGVGVATWIYITVVIYLCGCDGRWSSFEKQSAHPHLIYSIRVYAKSINLHVTDLSLIKCNSVWRSLETIESLSCIGLIHDSEYILVIEHWNVGGVKTREGNGTQDEDLEEAIFVKTCHIRVTVKIQ
jgi:hypothetical protein